MTDFELYSDFIYQIIIPIVVIYLTIYTLEHVGLLAVKMMKRLSNGRL